MRAERAAVALGLALGVVFGALHGASADEVAVERVVILGADDATATALVRLRGELNAAGFEVIELLHGHAPARDDIVRITREHEAIATVTLAELSGAIAVDLWLRDGRGGLVRRMTRVEADDAGRTLALRAVELLQSSLVELEETRAREPLDNEVTGLAAAPRLGAVHGLAGVRMPARRRPRAADADALGLEVALGGGAWLADGHRAGGPWLSVEWSLPWGLGWRALLAGPAWGTTLESTAGRATLRQLLVAVDMGWWWRPLDALRLRPAVGVGAWQLVVDGDGESPGTSRSATHWSAVVDASLALRWDANAWLALGAEAHAVVAVRPAIVDIAGTHAAHLGNPSALLTALAALRW